jgi:PTS system fructose-specific IIA component/PTS system nitrogen regulatory IIA component
LKLGSFLVREAVIPDLKATDKRGVIRELIHALVEAGEVPEKSAPSILASMMGRENLGSTGMGRGVALPHAKSGSVDRVMCAFGRSREGVDFSALDGEAVHLVFLEVSPGDPASAKEHLKAMSRMCERLRSDTTCRFLMEAEGRDEVEELLLDADEEVIG